MAVSLSDDVIQLLEGCQGTLKVGLASLEDGLLILVLQEVDLAPVNVTKRVFAKSHSIC